MMTESLFDGFEDDLRDGLRIGIMEIRRSIRGYFQQPRRKIALILLTLIFGSMVLFGGVPAAYSIGKTIRIEQQFPLLTAVRQLLTVFVLVLIALFLSRTIERLSHIDSEDLMLTTIPPRQFVRGRIVAGLVVSMPFVVVVPCVIALVGPQSALEVFVYCWSAVDSLS
jgi:hypothetical protein